MNRRSSLLAFCVAAASSLLAGCAPSWIVHSRATPDPFLNKRDFVILPIAFAGLRVGMKSEEGFLADKNAMQQQAFFSEKAALNSEYLRSVAETASAYGMHVVRSTTAPAGTFLIEPSVTSIDPGAGSDWPSSVRMLVRISTVQGQVLDTVEMTNRSTAYSSGERLRNDGVELGKTTAEYLKTRVMPGSG
jgi:hypothetical protein